MLLALTLALAAAPPVPTDAFGDALPEGAVARLGTSRFYGPAVIPQFERMPDGRFVPAGARGVVSPPGFSPDGKTVYIGTPSSVVAFAVADGRPRPLREPAGPVFALSPDGKVLAVERTFTDAGTAAHETRLIDPVVDRTVAVRRRVHPARALAFASGGRQLVRAVAGAVAVEDVATGKETSRIEIDASSIAVSRDGRLVAIGVKGGVELWEHATGKVRRVTTGGGEVASLSFDATGRKLLVAPKDGTISLWDLDKRKSVYVRPTARLGEPLRRFPPGWTPTPDNRRVVQPSVALSPDGRTGVVVYDAAPTGDVKAFDAGTGEGLWRGPFTFTPRAATFSPDGKRLVVATVGGPMVLDAADGKMLVPPPTNIWPARSAALRADGSAVTVGAGGTVTTWDARGVRLTSSPDVGHDGVYGASLDAAGRSVTLSPLNAALRSEPVAVFDVDTGRRLAAVPLKNERMRESALSADGGKVSVWTEKNRLIVADVRTGKVLGDFDARPDGDRPLPLYSRYDTELSSRLGIFTPDGRELICVGRDGLVVFNGATGERRKTIAGPVVFGHRAVSPDGRHLAVSGEDTPGSARLALYDLAGRWFRETRYRGSAGPVSFGPDGAWLLAASADPSASRVTRYDARTGRVLGSLDLPGRAAALGVSPHGKRLIAAMGDGTALVYDVP